MGCMPWRRNYLSSLRATLRTTRGASASPAARLYTANLAALSSETSIAISSSDQVGSLSIILCCWLPRYAGRALSPCSCLCFIGISKLVSINSKKNITKFNINLKFAGCDKTQILSSVVAHAKCLLCTHDFRHYCPLLVT
jgi:hypothetical protein